MYPGRRLRPYHSHALSNAFGRGLRKLRHGSTRSLWSLTKPLRVASGLRPSGNDPRASLHPLDRPEENASRSRSSHPCSSFARNLCPSSSSLRKSSGMLLRSCVCSLCCATVRSLDPATAVLAPRVSLPLVAQRLVGSELASACPRPLGCGKPERSLRLRYHLLLLTKPSPSAQGSGILDCVSTPLALLGGRCG